MTLLKVLAEGAVMKEPVDHILRPRLPWRSGDTAITECGYDASQVRTLTRTEFFQRKAIVTANTQRREWLEKKAARAAPPR